MNPKQELIDMIAKDSMVMYCRGTKDGFNLAIKAFESAFSEGASIEDAFAGVREIAEEQFDEIIGERR